MMNPDKRIGLFGGTFDPVHEGHLHLAGLARDALVLDEVRFIPCRISPHKGGCEPTGGGDRVEMLRRATEGVAWAVVDDCELAMDGPSFSYRTAELMAVRFPEARLFWVMGADQWAALPGWRNVERLAELVEFVVLARDGQHPEPREGYRLHVVHGEHPASATAIREAVAQGGAVKWLPGGVGEWIEERGLYEVRSEK